MGKKGGSAMYDVIIIGGGPAGLTATVYAVHKRMETLLITEDLGGKSNYHLALKGAEGHEYITGDDLVEKFKNQVQYLEFVRHMGTVTKVEAMNHHYAVHTKSGKRFEARAVIVCTGANPRFLDVPGARRLIGKGLSYSAISHAYLFVQKEVAVIGSGGHALRGAAELAQASSHVTIVAPTAGDLDTPLGKKLRNDPKVTILQGWGVQDIVGQDFVEALILKSEGGEERHVPVEGVLVELGIIPASQIVAGLVRTNPQGAIMIDAQNQTSRPGIFAAGDVTNVPPEQHLIAIGEGAKAALSAFEYQLRQNW
jgi:NADH-dependent peroxiredoxin subunit F